MTFKKELLNRLIDKYEKSKLFNFSSNRRIMLKREEISQFVNFENYIEKDIFIREIKELKSTELIDFSWQKYEEDNLIDVIWLIIENVSESYKITGRKNLKNVSKDIKEYLNEYIEAVKSSWIRDFFKDQIEYLDLKNRETKYLNFENYKDVANALLFIDTNTDLLERVFSIKCYGNSKYFEKNVKSKIIRIIKDYLLKDLSEEYTDEEVLLEVGIYKYPEIFEFNGNIQIEIDGKVEQYYLINRGSYINSIATSLITKIEFHNIKRILFIENKANYVDYISKEQSEDELIIWHGGMYSPKKELFFKKLYEYAPKEICWEHWSDIDLGGFRIFNRLKKNIVPELKEYNMNLEVLKKMQDRCLDFDEKYSEKLEMMLYDVEYKGFHEIIKYMLDNKIKLEQEAFL